VALDEVPFGEFDLRRHHRLAQVAGDEALAVAAGLERQPDGGLIGDGCPLSTMRFFRRGIGYGTADRSASV
jgi:hypothetical protein